MRARSQSSDYERIRRQRCVLGALAGQAQPVRLLRALPSLAGTMKRYVSTDIPRTALPDLIRLMARVDASRIVSVGFTPPDYTSGWVGPGYPVPDIEAIRAASHRAATATAPEPRGPEPRRRGLRLGSGPLGVQRAGRPAAAVLHRDGHVRLGRDALVAAADGLLARALVVGGRHLAAGVVRLGLGGGPPSKNPPPDLAPRRPAATWASTSPPSSKRSP